CMKRCTHKTPSVREVLPQCFRLTRETLFPFWSVPNQRIRSSIPAPQEHELNVSPPGYGEVAARHASHWRVARTVLSRTGCGSYGQERRATPCTCVDSTRSCAVSSKPPNRT